MKKIIFLIIVVANIVLLRAQNTSTPEDREALFDYIIEKTMDREAFSPAKERNLNFDPIAEMKKLKDEVVNADTDEELYYALVKLSCARRDRHLSVGIVEGGLEIPELDPLQAPIYFLPDFSSQDEYVVFVADFSKNIKDYTAGNQIEIGDRLIAVNGMSFSNYFEMAKPYMRYSAIPNLWRRFAHSMTGKSMLFPPSFYEEKLNLELKKPDGGKYSVSLPYLEEDSFEWEGYRNPKYPGFELVYERQTFHLYVPEDNNRKVILLWWYGFREDLPKDMDELVEYAKERDMLDYDLIIDLTESRGGSRGAYAIQRLSPKPFKTTFGNLKLSDITTEFIHQRNERYVQSQQMYDSGVRETDDDGTWLIDWLNGDVIKGLARGQEYSNDVPFKNAHLPEYSDGILDPAEKHFTGNLVCLLGPWGGSHLDQFAAIVQDNDLGYAVGMPAGGYSNTWEWDEELHFPISGKPVVEFMWNIGHTIRPNGEILEGNPAVVDKYIPLTRENFMNYYEILLNEATKWLQNQRQRP